MQDHHHLIEANKNEIFMVIRVPTRDMQKNIADSEHTYTTNSTIYQQ